jgi:hypothetical protein
MLVWVSFGLWVERVVLPVLLVLTVVCDVAVFSRLCVCFFSVSLVLVLSLLCSCVGQTMFGHIKIVSVTVFFLMKNMFRYRREKRGAKDAWSSGFLKRSSIYLY